MRTSRCWPDTGNRLSRARDAEGRPFEIAGLPMPRPVVFEGTRLPATYVNFYFINGALLCRPSPTANATPLRCASCEAW